MLESLAAALLLLAAGAQDYRLFKMSPEQEASFRSPAYDRCLDGSGGVTVAMRDCTAAEMARLDVRLNQAYRAAMARLPDDRARARLRALERQWLAGRWSRCRREAGEEPESGGTLGLLLLDSCGLDEMQRRIAWLEAYGRTR